VSPSTILPNCAFTNNSAMNGGGSFGGGMFTNSTFVGNMAMTNGGAVDIAAMSHCLVASNQAGFGGGAYVSNSPAYLGTHAFYLNCEFAGNSATVDGGGVYAPSIGANLAATNCNFEGNSALNSGGAGFQGTYANGTLRNNSALNGGAVYNATVSRCNIFSNTVAGSGGGVYNGTIQYCSLSNNIAGTNGGGCFNATLVNSLETGNSAANGGGASGGTLNNSTLVGNTATVMGGGFNGPGGTISSCIIYDNTAPSGSNYIGQATYGYSCTAPLPPGTGNVVSDPGFINMAAGNFRLQTNSPCIDKGNSSSGIVDLDGRRRLVGAKIDIGAYEFQGPSMGEFTAWLQERGLPMDGSADGLDSDGDGTSNWQEWVAGTGPLDAASVLKVLAPAFTNDVTSVTVTWQSVPDRTYFLQRAADLAAPFSTIQSNIVGQSGTTSVTDTNGLESGPFFYRVGVQ
jgi:predicted outer membrane repeat protein